MTLLPRLLRTGPNPELMGNFFYTNVAKFDICKKKSIDKYVINYNKISFLNYKKEVPRPKKAIYQNNENSRYGIFN